MAAARPSRLGCRGARDGRKRLHVRGVRRRDLETRQRLLDDGTLFDGYHPEMEQVHRENAEQLAEIVGTGCWPGRSQVGEDGCAAVFLVAAHAISRPDLQRRWLALLEDAAERGEVPRRQAAVLGDRIRFHEGRPQRFGAIFDGDENGELTAGPIEDPEGVDARREAVGLGPLSETLAAEARRGSAAGETPSGDFARRQRQRRRWARKVCWR